MWDAAGVESTVTRMKALGIAVSPVVEELLAAGQTSWYAQDGRECFQPETKKLEPVPAVQGHAKVADFRRSNGVVRSNSGASLIDIGDGIGLQHRAAPSLKNGHRRQDVLAMISSVLKPDSDAVRDFARLS